MHHQAIEAFLGIVLVAGFITSQLIQRRRRNRR